MSPRIAPLSPPYPEQVQESFDKLMPSGMEPLRLFRTLAHNPRVLERVRRGGLLDPGSISMKERELVILRTTALCSSEYEWGVHVRFFADAAGLSTEQVHATVGAEAAAGTWNDSEQALLQACDELHTGAHLSDATFAQLSAHFSAEQIVEVLILAGLYHAISFVTNGAHIELEEGAERFPQGAG